MYRAYLLSFSPPPFGPIYEDDAFSEKKLAKVFHRESPTYMVPHEYLLSPWICSFENRLYENTHSAALYGAAYYRLFIPIYHILVLCL